MRKKMSDLIRQDLSIPSSTSEQESKYNNYTVVADVKYVSVNNSTKDLGEKMLHILYIKYKMTLCTERSLS